MLSRGHLPSIIFWGPPGVGKTTLARLLAQHIEAEMLTLSAVTSGVKDIRGVIDQARALNARQIRTVLFVDEVHRFNKAQQDAFLPFVEDGLITLIGATTENPAFELNAALLSRARVLPLKSLDASELSQLIDRGLGARTIAPNARDALVDAADGDARRCLGLLESAMDLTQGEVELSDLAHLLGAAVRRFDKGGDQFYDQISALHKSLRGSSPDAALYWLARMLDGGCDPLYLARRMVRMASEDIGNADPRALQVAMDAYQATERLGMPEAELALAQAATFLASVPKSNAVYTAWKSAKALAAQGSLEVPNHLRNAPTSLAKEMGHGAEYRYAHDEPEAYAAGVNYFPDALAGTRLYKPVNRGLEIKIGERLARLRMRDQS
jgi:putative ATPase